MPAEAGPATAAVGRAVQAESRRTDGGVGLQTDGQVRPVVAGRRGPEPGGPGDVDGRGSMVGHAADRVRRRVWEEGEVAGVRGVREEEIGLEMQARVGETAADADCDTGTGTRPGGLPVPGEVEVGGFCVWPAGEGRGGGGDGGADRSAVGGRVSASLSGDGRVVKRRRCVGGIQFRGWRSCSDDDDDADAEERVTSVYGYTKRSRRWMRDRLRMGM